VSSFFDAYDTPANTADSAVLFAAYHLGLAISVALLIALFSRLRWRLRGSSGIDKAYVLIGVSVFLVFALTVGDLFVVMQRGIFAGAYLGALMNKRL
jgi:hypothetical protein